MSDSNDAIVIGGGVSGLVAATYLARGGKRVRLLEASERLGGSCASFPIGEGYSASPRGNTLNAFDHRVIKELNLVRHGLKFTVRDMPLSVLRSESHALVLRRDVHATASSIAVYSQRDAEVWPHFRRELHDLGRAMRPFWFGEQQALPTGEVARKIDRLSRTSAAAWLDSWFGSDAPKAALSFDATADGFSPDEAGSALILVWRAAQEMWGLQGAVSTIVDGTLVASLVAAAQAAGVTMHSGARVEAIETDGELAKSLRLAGGEVLDASSILCSLSLDVCRSLMPSLSFGIAYGTVAPHRRSATGEASVLLALRGGPELQGSAAATSMRYVVAETAESLVASNAMARTGELPSDLTMELIVSAGDSSLAGHIVSMLIRPVPRQSSEGWQNTKARLAERAIRKLEEVLPGTASRIVAAKVLSPDELDASEKRRTVADMLLPYEKRVRPFLRNLLFCGADAEPVTAVSGRSARIAAQMALASK